MSNGHSTENDHSTEVDHIPASKFWLSISSAFLVPIIVAIGVFFVLQYRVGANEKKIENIERKQEEINDIKTDIEVLKTESSHIKRSIERNNAILRDINRKIK